MRTRTLADAPVPLAHAALVQHAEVVSLQPGGARSRKREIVSCGCGGRGTAFQYSSTSMMSIHSVDAVSSWTHLVYTKLYGWYGLCSRLHVRVRRDDLTFGASTACASSK